MGLIVVLAGCVLGVALAEVGGVGNWLLYFTGRGFSFPAGFVGGFVLLVGGIKGAWLALLGHA
jgi:hypothetical protein